MSGLTIDVTIRTGLAVAAARDHLAIRRGAWARIDRGIRWRRWALNPVRLEMHHEGPPGRQGQLVDRRDTRGHLSKKASREFHARREAAAR